jgi:hypothetical protein
MCPVRPPRPAGYENPHPRQWNPNTAPMNRPWRQPAPPQWRSPNPAPPRFTARAPAPPPQSSSSGSINILSPQVNSMQNFPLTPINMSLINVIVCHTKVKALLDSGSCENFLDQSLLKLFPDIKPMAIKPITVSMAHEVATVQIRQYCMLNLECLLKSGNRKYENVKVLIMPNSLHPLILGLPFFKLHNTVQFDTKGNLPSLQVCSLKAVSLPSVLSPFRTLTNDV